MELKFNILSFQWLSNLVAMGKIQNQNQASMSNWHKYKGITKDTAIYESGLSDRIKEFRKIRRRLQRKHQLNPALGYLFYDCFKVVTFYEMVEVSFHFIGTTAAGSRCLQNVIRKVHVSVWQTTSKNCTKRRAHLQHDYFSSFNQSYHWFVAFPLPSSFLKLCIPNLECSYCQ